MTRLGLPRRGSPLGSRCPAAATIQSRALVYVILGVGLGLPSGGLASTVPATESSGQVRGVATFAAEGAADNAVVYLMPVASGNQAPAAAAPTDRVYLMDQRGLRFDPHVLVVPVGATVEFTNSDDVLHNVFVPPLDTQGFDLGTWPPSETRRHTFEEPGVNVLLCNVHPDMEAFIVVVPTAYYGVTGEDGSFSIEGLPAGRYTLLAWHERCDPYETEIEVGDGANEVPIVLSVRGRRQRY